mgnify:CR=1 FL=1
MNNKHRKEKTMRKMAIVIGILSVLATSAQAGGYVCKPNIYGGTTCVYQSWVY